MLTYKDFEKHIEAIKDQSDFQEGLDTLVQAYNEKRHGLGHISFPSLSSNVAELLEHEMGDEHGWVFYWIWELDFGKKYRPGCVMDESGKEIKLATVHDLYLFLSARKE